jgi:MFS family permease
MAVHAAPRPMTPQEKKVIFASSLGTVFEWYDFYLYGSLAAIIAKQFFSGLDSGSAFIFALLAFAAGFIVRPFGAIFFGRLGDMIGRKYTFLITILIMGSSTFVVGILPGYDSIGVAAPVILIALRLLQGLALGGEYGGAATYVAEHAPHGKRGAYTSWIQTTATLGLFLSLLVILGTQTLLGPKAFGDWGWRVPFIASAFLLAVSVWIRLSMNESPAFQRMKAEGRTSKAPLTESFGQWKNLKIVILALVGLTAGQAVVWYSGQFYALFFLTQALKVDGPTANILVAVSLLIGTPFFVVFGALSDKIGRKPIIMAGCLLAAITYFPVFGDEGGEPGSRGRTGEKPGDRDRRPGRVLVPVQPDRHREVHQFMRHRQAGAGRRVGELRQHRRSCGHGRIDQDRRTRDSQLLEQGSCHRRSEKEGRRVQEARGR